MKLSDLGRRAIGLSLFGLFLVLLGASTLTISAAGRYHLLKKVALPSAPRGTDYFDYITVDPEARRVYLSHGTEVQVLDADNYAVVGKVTGMKRCHGIALVKEIGKGFITDGEAQEVVIFDLATLKVMGKVKTNQPDTDSIIYDPASKHIFTFNGDSHNATVIDPVKQTVLKNLDLVGGVEFPVTDEKGMIYDNNKEKNDVVAIDSRDITVKARWPVAPAGQPVAMDMDRKTRRLFSAGRDPKMLVLMDADNGKVLQSFPITDGADAVSFDPETAMVFVSTEEGMLHIFHEDTPNKLSVVQTVKTEYGAKTMGFDAKTHNLYLATTKFGPKPAPTAQEPDPDPPVIPGTFHLLVYGY
jgi:DNA-binding beta-propeller fold protein YncE